MAKLTLLLPDMCSPKMDPAQTIKSALRFELANTFWEHAMESCLPFFVSCFGEAVWFKADGDCCILPFRERHTVMQTLKSDSQTTCRCSSLTYFADALLCQSYTKRHHGADNYIIAEGPV
jgi:hypothetical protein